MEIKKLKYYLTTRYLIAVLSMVLLACALFTINYFNDKSHSQSFQVLEDFGAYQHAINEILNYFDGNNKSTHTISENVYNSYLLLNKIRDNETLNSVFKSVEVSSVQLRNELRNINANLNSLRNIFESLKNKRVRRIPEQLITTLIDLRRQINELNTILVKLLQKSSDQFSKYNLIIFIGTLILLHLLIIFVFRPSTKKIVNETQLLAGKMDNAISIVQSKSDYLATMSHEIRTPLNGVLGLTSLLLETKTTPEQKEYLELLNASGESLLQIINDILDFSKIETSSLDLNEMYFSISGAVEEIVEIYLPKAVENDLELLYLIEPDVPDYILGDAQRIKQCISNLIINALKYTRKGEILLRVNVLNQINDKYEIQFAVSDTGIGIPANKIPLLFKPFHQSKEPVAKRYEGTHLGLAITAKLVELMNGRIWVESEINKGSTFYIACYFQRAQQKDGLNIKNQHKLLNNKNVLIFEPKDNERKLLNVQCHNWGMHPKSFVFFKDVLKTLKQSEIFDFIIIDQDTFMNISDSLEKIRAYSKYTDIPVVLLSTESNIFVEKNEETKTKCLIKPVKQSKLHETLLGFIKDSEIISENAHDSKTNNLNEQNINLLLAEDNLINQKLMERIINRLGYSVDIAQNGSQAFDMSSQKKYHIIFMDLQMPELDGIEATRKILASHDVQDSPKIIAMTANVQIEDKEMCFEAGMVDYLAKPVNIEKIKEIIEYWSQRN